MKKIFQKLVSWCKRALRAVTPGKNALNGAAKVLLFIVILLLLLSAIIDSINTNDAWLVLFYIGYAVLFGLLAIGINWTLKMLMNIPKLLRFALMVSFFVLTILFRENLAYMIVAVGSVLGAASFSLLKTKFKNLTLVKKIISLLGFGAAITFVVIGIVGYIVDGVEVDPMINAAFTSKKEVAHIPLESTATEGTFQVKTLYYGSGKDKHRKHFGANVDIETDAVNGVAFLDNWDGLSGWWRTKYWGFDSKSLPLNAQVWYPEGDGPFPLVLIVHGNHGMQDYSDTGYEYLGKLLASRGMIAASVDENFLNSSWSDTFSDGLEKENDARAWILLEHLRQWHEWNASETSLFYQKIDTDKLSLIGHSRGGEAVGHAALLNTLPHYSDDATIKLNYHYNIKSIVAIAPVDGQYKPGGTKTRLKDIDYFVIHGAQDADVNSYAGNKQFDRISFADNGYHFKAGLYVYGANHGQFNTSWGMNDAGIPFVRLLNLQQLLKGKDQREIAKVYISAFLEASLRGDKRYLPLFTDVRTGKNWLPETIYLNQFEDSNTDIFANFEEDFDVTTFTKDAMQATSSQLTVWKEKKIPMKWASKESRGLFLGWHYHKKDKEAKKKDSLSSKMYAPVHDSLIARYSIHLNGNIPKIDTTSVFVFSMADAKESSNPKSGGKWIDKNKDKKNQNKKDEKKKNKEEKPKKTKSEKKKKKGDGKKKKEDGKKKAKEPIDFSIALKDSLGREIYFPLSDYSKLQRRMEVELWKLGDDKYDKSENVLQQFSFPIREMLIINPEFDFSTLTQITFVFDRTDRGVVLIDNIGFMKDVRTLPR